MFRTAALLLIALTVAHPTLAPAQPSRRAGQPMILVELDPSATSAVGLPAVAADGNTVALVESESDLSGAGSFSVRFLRVSDGGTTLEVPITAVDQDGQARRVSTTHGRTAWARARLVNAELTRGAYRPLVELKRPDDERRWVGGGLRARYDSRNGQFAILGARGVARARLARQQVSCGMELEHAGQVIVRPAEVIAVHADAATGATLLTYGLRYASCMCVDDVSYRLARLAR